MTEINERICKHCRWWQDYRRSIGEPFMIPSLIGGGQSLEAGTCRRRAPIMHYPQTSEIDWCGEWEEKRETA